jgi:hypothetical protein
LCFQCPSSWVCFVAVVAMAFSIGFAAMYYVKGAGQQRMQEYTTEEALEEAKKKLRHPIVEKKKFAVKMTGHILKQCGIGSGKTKRVCNTEAEAREIITSLEAAAELGAGEFAKAWEAHKLKSAPSQHAQTREHIEATDLSFKLFGPLLLPKRASSQIKLSWKEKGKPDETITGTSEEMSEIWERIKAAPNDKIKVSIVQAGHSRQSHEEEGTEGQRYRTAYYNERQLFAIWYMDDSTVAPNGKSTVLLPSAEHSERLKHMLRRAATNAKREEIMVGARTAKAEEPAGTSNTANLCPMCLADPTVPNPHPIATNGTCWSHNRAAKDGRPLSYMQRKAAHHVDVVAPISDEELFIMLATSRVIVFTNATDPERPNEDTVTGRRLQALLHHGIVEIPLYGSQFHSSDSSCTNSVKATRVKAARLWLQQHVHDFKKAHDERNVTFLVAGKNAAHALQDVYHSMFDQYLGFPAPMCLASLVPIEQIPYPDCWDGARVGAAEVEGLHEKLGITREVFRHALEGSRKGIAGHADVLLAPVAKRSRTSHQVVSEKQRCDLQASARDGAGGAAAGHSAT